MFLLILCKPLILKKLLKSKLFLFNIFEKILRYSSKLRT